MSKSTKTVIPAKAGIQQTNGLVPRLRFPEFRDAGEWDIAPLKKLASRRTERNRDGKLTRVLTNSAEHGVVDQRDYFDKDIAIQGNLENYFIVKKDDFVYNPRISAFAPVGPISRNRVETGVMSPLYTVFEFKGSNTDFYAQYFKSSAWHMYMRQVGSTGARHDRMAISNEDFMAMPLPVPSAEEQQKIADCLSSLDALIVAQADKIDALKTHKKGLMQQLFPREGETVPRLRFPEFRDAGEWKPKPLGRLCDNISSGKDKSDPKGTYNLYGSTGIIGNTASGTYSGVYILVARVGANAGRLTKTEGVFGVTDNTLVLHLKNLGIVDFIYCWLDKTGLNKLVFGSGQPLLTGKQLKELELCFPSQEEQERIADCLSSLDALIAAHAEKLEALKSHKKGLMQQLFPSPEAV
jgi:type I restriction enzyme S subunit